jgi:serine/threonine-protein kinase
VATQTQSRSDSAVASIDAAISAVKKFSRSAWLDLVRRDQCERWRSGGRTRAEEYFDLLPELRADREEVLVLICGEMQLRRELCEEFTLDEYERRFPDFAADIELQYDADGVLPSGPNLLLDEDGPLESPSLPLTGYEILKELGRGASGVVYLARQVSTNRLVAVKAITLSSRDAHRLSRQRQEAAILSRLQHPNIVQIHDVVEADGMLCLIIEYVDGPTLGEFAAGKPQPPVEAARLVQTLAAAIHVVHDAGILHRDLKPSNILLTRAGDPKITDFGLAKLVSGENLLTTDNCLLGTPCYMPPEQATVDGRNAARQGDVYSLGAILYELLTGHPPFVGVTVLDTLSLIRDRDPIPCRNSQPKTPRDLETICLKCLKKDPQQRYQTAATLAADLGRYLDGSAIEAQPPSWKERAEKWCRRRPAVAILAVSLALAIVTGFCGILWQWNDAESAHQSETAARRLADQRADEIQRGLERLRTAMNLEDHGRAFHSERRWDDAVNTLQEAVALCPELNSAWDELGQVYADLGLWYEALEHQRHAFANEPALSGPWLSYAALLANAGDRAGSRLLWAKMQQRFAGHGHGIATDVDRAACLFQDAEVDYVRLAMGLRADRSQPHGPVYFYALGLVRYRAKDYAQAVEQCLASLKDGRSWPERALNLPVLALAYTGLGDVDNGRTYLAQATEARDQVIQSLFASGEKNWSRHKGASAEWQISPYAWLEFNLLYNEARRQQNLPELKDDPRLVVLRARALTAIHRLDEAGALYDRAVALAPEVVLIRMEQHRCAAYRFVDRRDFGRAAAEFAEAERLAPADTKLWVYLAQAHLAAGNIDAYKDVCRRMYKLHAATNDPEAADRVVWTCANRADSLPNMDDLLALANRDFAGFSISSHTRGAASVRAGRYEEALRWFDEQMHYNALLPADMCFQAIACFHLGQFDQSRRRIQDAENWIAQADRQKLPNFELKTPAWGNFGWDEHLEALRLLDEAKTLTSHRPAATKTLSARQPDSGD